MIYLILAILFSTAIFVVMRLFKRFELDNHQALAWNYATATVIGFAMSAANGALTLPVSEPWFPLSILTGFWFILTYVLMVVMPTSIILAGSWVLMILGVPLLMASLL